MDSEKKTQNVQIQQLNHYIEALEIKTNALADTDLILDKTSDSPVVINGICWRES